MTKKKPKIIVCGKCENNVTKTQYSLQCAGDCARWFHKKCTDLSDEQYLAYEQRKNDEKWICADCSQNVSNADSDTSEDEAEPTNKDVLRVMNNKFMELEKSLTFNGDIMEQLQKTIKEILDENKKLKKEQEQLKHKINDLEKQVTIINKKLLKEDCEGRRKNIIISGIKSDKYAESNAKKVLSKLGEEPEDCKISVLPTANTGAIIVAEFPTEDRKKKVLEKRKNVELTYLSCGIADSPVKVFINEDLPRETRDLFKKARDLKRDGYKYVWCKEGQVYARKGDGEAVVKINSLSDVDKLKTRE